jgi:hypothetical protein
MAYRRGCRGSGSRHNRFGDAGCKRAGARPLEDAERVPQQSLAPRHRGRAGRGDGRPPVRRQFRAQVLRARRPGAGPGMLRRGVERLGRVLLDHARLSHRQISGAGVLHRGAIWSRLWRVPRLDDLRRRQGPAERDLCSSQFVLDRLQHDRAGDIGLVQAAGRLARGPQGPQDAVLRPRRAGHAEARRVDPAARRRRHLSGSGAR